MTSDTGKPEAVEQLLDTPELATALESEQFKKFLDQVPIAIAVSDLIETERVVYAIVHNGSLDPGTQLLPKPFSLQDLAEKVRTILDDPS